MSSTLPLKKEPIVTSLYETKDAEEFNCHLVIGEETFLMNRMNWVLDSQGTWIGLWNPETRQLDRSSSEPQSPNEESIVCSDRNRFISTEEAFCDTLRKQRASLQQEGTSAPSGFSRECMDAVQERQRKIRAIEDCLLAFRSYFRTG